MLFQLDKQSKVIIHPEILKMVNEFNVLDNREMLFVILYADYNSIFSQFTPDERCRKSTYHVWGDYILDILKRPKINAAINAYMSLQYNPKLEQVRVYQNKINDLLNALMGLTTGKEIKDNMDATEKLRAGIRELEQEVIESYQEENRVLVGGGERSFLEKVMANKALYASIIKKK